MRLILILLALRPPGLAWILRSLRGQFRFLAVLRSVKDISMNNIKIGVIVGSLRQGSINARLATALFSLASEGVSFQRIAIDDLPSYSGDSETNPGAAVERFRNEVRAVDGILFVTPEYNRSIPGVLKNAIDHGSRPYGKSVWTGKPTGHRSISRRYRHRNGTAASAQRPCVSQHANTGAARSVHPSGRRLL